DLADLAAEAHLADGDRAAVDRTVEAGRGNRQDEGEIGRGLGDPDPTDGERIEIGAGEVEPGTLLEDGEEERHPPRIDPCAARRGEPGDSLATSAWSSTRRGRWPSMVGTTTEPDTPVRRSARKRRL